MPTCPICNKEMKYINNSHLKSHGLTPTQFKELYPDVDAIPQEIREANKRNGLAGKNASRKTGLKKMEELIIKYNQNPKICKSCNCCMSYEKRRNKFCSKSCSVSFSNKTRKVIYSEEGMKSLIENILKNKKILQANRKKGNTEYKKNCTICNNIFVVTCKNKNKKTCSNKCLKKYQSLNNAREGNIKTKWGYYKGIYCASSWELAFLIHNLDLCKEIKRCELTFGYELKGEEHLYFPDFMMDGIIYEVKGRELEDVELKTQSVIDAGYTIEVIRKKQIEPIIKEIKKKYKVKDITQLYDKKI